MKVTGALAILLLFVIGFNPYNIHAILHGAPVYGNISIYPYIGYLIRSFVRLLIFVCIFVAMIPRYLQNDHNEEAIQDQKEENAPYWASTKELFSNPIWWLSTVNGWEMLIKLGKNS